MVIAAAVQGASQNLPMFEGARFCTFEVYILFDIEHSLTFCLSFGSHGFRQLSCPAFCSSASDGDLPPAAPWESHRYLQVRKTRNSSH